MAGNVTQTVHINVVIRGSGGTKEVKALEEPLKQVAAQAKIAGMAISDYIVTALQRAINLAARLNVVMLRVGANAKAGKYGAAFGAVAGASSGAGDAIDDNTEKLNKQNKALQEYTDKTNKAGKHTTVLTKHMHTQSRVLNFLYRQINTIIKAITSMIGVMIAWTALITIPTMLVRAFIDLTKAALSSADAIQQVQISLAALIASTHDFGGTIAENFKQAHDWAKRAHIEFIRLSADSLATADELEYGYQAFLAGGGQGLVKNLEEELKLTELLSSSTLTLTGRQQAARQIFTELNAALEGTQRPGAQLIRFIQAQVGDYDKWISKIRESRNGLEEFTRVLEPFIEAGKKQAVTITGLTTSIKGYAESLGLLALRNDAFVIIQEYLLKIRDTLSATIVELDDFRGGLEDLSEPVQKVVIALSNVAASIQGALIFAMRAVGIYVDIQEPAKALEQISYKIVAGVATAAAFVRGMGEAFEYVVRAAKTLWSVLLSIWAVIKVVALFIANLFLTIIGKSDLGILAQFNAAKRDVPEAIERIKDSWSSFMETVRSDKSPFLNFGKHADAYEAEILALAQRILNSVLTAIRQPEGPPPEGTVVEVMTEAQQRMMERMTEQYELLRAYDNEIQRVLAQQARKYAEIDRTFQGTIKYKKEALELHKKITEELLLQAAIQQTRNLEGRAGTVMDAFKIHAASSEDLRKATGALAEHIMYLKTRLSELRDQFYRTNDVIEQAGLQTQIKMLEDALLEAVVAFDKLTNIMQVVDIAFARLSKSMRNFLETGTGFFTVLQDMATYTAVLIGEGMGRAFTQMFEAMMSGEDAMESFLKFLGQMLIQVGEMAVAYGTISLIMSAIPWMAGLTNPAAAVALIAVGAGMIAAGVAMGGAGSSTSAATGTSGGGATEPAGYRREQHDIAAQQSMYDAINANTDAVNTLNDELSRLSKETGDVLVARTVKKNPESVFTPLTNSIGRSYSKQKKFKTALNTATY